MFKYIRRPHQTSYSSSKFLTFSVSSSGWELSCRSRLLPPGSTLQSWTESRGCQSLTLPESTHLPRRLYERRGARGRGGHVRGAPRSFAWPRPPVSLKMCASPTQPRALDVTPARWPIPCGRTCLDGDVGPAMWGLYSYYRGAFRCCWKSWIWFSVHWKKQTTPDVTRLMLH